MESIVIISDFLKKDAEEHQAVERGVIQSWGDISEETIAEDVIILDTKLELKEDKNGARTAAGMEKFELLEYLRVRLPNLLEKGKTVVALCDEIKRVHATDRRTWGSHNYHWLSYFGEIRLSDVANYDEDFIFNIPDPWDIQLVDSDDPFNSYFLNVAQTSVSINPENSKVEEYEEIASFPNDVAGDEVPAIAIKSWVTEKGDLVEPDGRLVLLPRPHKLRVDVESWFRSLLQIGNHYSPNEFEIDQFNRILNRSTSPALNRVYTLCDRFPEVARQLEDRYADRDTITVEDEYDVQDLLYGLLRVFFDDVRGEEWAPSYGGSSPRIDFLLKDETIAIEVKITREGRGNKEVKQELAEDKEHYRSHPDCETLVCYVFDPGYEIDNPAGFENDLSEQTEELNTEVLISSTSRFGSV